MILISHALIGASAARIISSNPLAAFIVGWASHYVADAIPHWQYHLKSLMKEPGSDRTTIGMARDITYVGLDFGIGILLPIYFFSGLGNGNSFLSIVLGAFGGMFPDALQFFHWLVPKGLLDIHQKFHDWVHTENELHQGSVSGVLLQVAIVAACVLISKAITR